jgi:hypothetical protein
MSKNTQKKGLAIKGIKIPKKRMKKPNVNHGLEKIG